MNTPIVTALIVIGVFSLVLAIVLCICVKIVSILCPAPAWDSNEALKNWLLCHPNADIDDYLHNKPDRCVIQ